MRKIYKLVFAFMVLLSVTMSATALQQKTINRQNGMQAYAEWIEDTSIDKMSDTFLSVTQSDVGTDIYLSICTSTFVGGSCKSGMITQDNNVFSMDKKLDSASLKSVTIEMSQSDCYLKDDVYICTYTPAGTATIEATWTGTGKLSTGSYKWTSRDGNYMSRGSSSSSSRTATAQGTLNNKELGTSNFGGLAKFKSVDMWMTK